MTDKKKIYKPQPISGFPEWTPDVRYVEQQWLDQIRGVFESYGFCNIETPSVEALDVIAAKGEDVDKEVYVLERLQADPDEKKEARLALHFDQTVPLARYTAQHFNDLVFPFKRYQMQRVWRGERPQAGRFREFYQCDIDVINIDNLPLHFDAEMPAIIWEILSSLPGMENETIQIQINNRKIFIGLMNSILRPEDKAEVLRVLDKRQKLDPKEFDKLLDESLEKHLENETAFNNTKHDLLELFKFRDKLVTLDIKEQIEQLEKIYIGHASYEEYQKIKDKDDLPVLKTPATPFYVGIEELIKVMKGLLHLPPKSVAVDFFMVRGLDYYTGTVYETVFVDDPTYGSICSGGRYDDLASGYINKHLPGVGISIGFSRLFDRLRQQGKLPKGRLSPADILMLMPEEEQRAEANATAKTLRERGYKVEVSHGGKINKQFSYAEKKGIPFVWLPFSDGHKVKDLSTGEQTDGDATTWEMPGSHDAQS